MKTDYYPSIEQVLRLYKQADVDKLEQRNLRPLLTQLHKIAYFSPRISGHILTRRTAINSYNWHFKGSDSVVSSLLKSKLNNFINAIIYHYIDGVCFGAFAIKYFYELDEDNYQVPVIDDIIPPVELDYQDNIIYKYIINDKKYYALNDDEIVSYIYNPFTRGGILRTVLMPEILRHQSTVEWSNLNKLLKGIITSIIDPEKVAQAQALMQLSKEQITDNLTNIDTAVKYSEQYNYLRTLNFAEIKTQSIADAKSGTSYREFIDALNADIAIAFLGQANTTELPDRGGSRAALNVINLIRADILYSDLLNIKTMINKFMLQFSKLNFNPSTKTTLYEFDWIFDENEDVETNARTFEYIARIGGVQVESNEFYSKIGLTKPATVDNVIVLGERSL